MARSRWPSPLKSPATRAVRIIPHREAHRLLKRPVPVAQEHRDVVGVEIGGGQVEVAVAVEVPRHEGVGDLPHPKLTAFWNVPSPLPRSTETSLETVSIGGGQVEAAVAVEVPRHEGERRPSPTVKLIAFWNVPSPLPRSTEMSVGAGIGGGQVEAAVAVEVPRHEGVRIIPHREVHRLLERPVPVAQEHRDVVGVVIGGGQVEAAVAVEVPRHEGEQEHFPTVKFAAVLERPVPVAQEHRDVAGVAHWRWPGRGGRRR